MLYEIVAAGALAGLSSTPHCAAMCGPLAALACRGADRVSAGRAARYHLGRAAGYAALGSIAGVAGARAIGALSSIAGRWGAAAISWAVAAALLIAALRTWRPPARAVAPPIRLGARRPDLRGRLLAILPRGPFALGLATALLPCGALFAALALAAASGGALLGATAMLAFVGSSGLGLLAIGALAGRADRRPWSRRTLAVGLAVGAVVLVARPLPALRAAPGEVPACHRGVR
jgi:sulfite exporter TauE/SafE